MSPLTSSPSPSASSLSPPSVMSHQNFAAGRSFQHAIEVPCATIQKKEPLSGRSPLISQEFEERLEAFGSVVRDAAANGHHMHGGNYGGTRSSPLLQVQRPEPEPSPPSSLSPPQSTSRARPGAPLGACPKGHTLRLSVTKVGTNWICDGCERNSDSFSEAGRYRCDECDYDLCLRCRSRQGAPTTSFCAQAPVTCSQGHQLLCHRWPGVAGLQKRWVCDVCETDSGALVGRSRFNCQRCDYDLCDTCHAKACQTGLNQDHRGLHSSSSASQVVGNRRDGDDAPLTIASSSPKPVNHFRNGGT